MSRPFQGVIDIDIRDSVPDWAPYVQPVAPEGAPNVLYIVLDDVGFSAMEPWGGLIETPIINRLARNGLTYTNWHTTALCSPTRSSLLTGRNHTTNGMACIAEATSGFPNANGHIPFECATIAEVLGERGWNTYMLGRWHLVAADEMNMASTKRNWPVGRGFERYYGFLGGETNSGTRTWSTTTTRWSSRPCPVGQGPQAQVRLQLRRQQRADDRVHQGGPNRPGAAVGRLRQGGRRHAHHRDALAVRQRRAGRRGTERGQGPG
jgi:arylsulfatase A-like enzyme